MSRLDRLSKYTYILPKQNQSKQAGSRGWCLRSRENDDGIKTASRPATGYVKVKVMRVGSHAFCDPLFQKILQNKGGGMYLVFPVIIIITVIVLLQCLSCSFGQN